LRQLIASLDWHSIDDIGRASPLGKGQFLFAQNLDKILQKNGIRRESIADRPGISYIRRSDDEGYWYFITNQNKQFVQKPDTPPLDQWITLAVSVDTVLIMDPISGIIGKALTRTVSDKQTQVYLQIEPGQSIILRAFKTSSPVVAKWNYYQSSGQALAVDGLWKVQFIIGGPELPAPFETKKLESWTKLGDSNTRRFAGTARYSLLLDVPPIGADAWILDLGRVAESAAVRLNGQLIGTVFCDPFRIQLTPPQLNTGSNLLEIDD
jgi:hypothetical protein